jgi:hypothetical protein
MQPHATRSCCEIRRHLAEEFAIAARLYAEAVVSLTCESGIMPHEDYSRLREAAEMAQLNVEAACRAFQEHVDLHRWCGPICQKISAVQKQ